MKVFLKEPGKKPVWTDVENVLESLQEAVDGYIETVTLMNHIVLICDESGKLCGKEPNIRTHWGETVCGTVIVCGAEEDRFTDLRAEYKEPVRKLLERMAVGRNTRGKHH